MWEANPNQPDVSPDNLVIRIPEEPRITECPRRRATDQIEEHDRQGDRREIPARDRDLLSRIKSADLSLAIRQLATLLHAGMPLVPALAALVEQLKHQPLAPVIQDIQARVNAGTSLAAACRPYPGLFSDLFLRMVYAGESSGSLEAVLLRLAEMMEKRDRLAAQIRSALAYPLVMILVAIGVVIFLMSFVVPSLTGIFLEMNQQLPWPTRLLIRMSSFLEGNLLWLVLAAAALAVGGRRYIQSGSGKPKWDRFKLKLPVFGPLLRKAEAARFTRMLGIMLSSGISILDTLTIAQTIIQNHFLAQSLDSVKQSVARGEPIARSLRRTGLFSPIVYHTIAIGEISGNLEEQLAGIAGSYETELETAARTLMSLLEPVLLIVMAAWVGFIVLAILLPIFEINQMI